MPVFGLAFLHDALVAKGEGSGPRAADLQRRMSNAVLPEAGSAHVEELTDPYLMYFWNSNIRSTAIALSSFVKAGVAGAPIREIVRWLMAARKDGRWGNTQENAYAMEALVAYYRKYESTVPDFRAVVTFGSSEVARQEFKGRSTVSSSRDVAMPTVLAAGPRHVAAGDVQPKAAARSSTRCGPATPPTRSCSRNDSGFRVARR